MECALHISALHSRKAVKSVDDKQRYVQETSQVKEKKQPFRYEQRNV